MEQCFRIALWMFVLIGHLHAGPVCPLKTLLEFDELRNISCSGVNFTSPTNVESNCHTAALREFKEGMIRAQQRCEDGDNQLGQTLEVMERYLPPTVESCNFTMTDHKQFAGFVNTMETFVEEFCSQ